MQTQQIEIRTIGYRYHYDESKGKEIKIVAEYQATDDNLHIIEGDKITSADNLIDRIHLSIESAGMLADELYWIVVER